MQFIVNEEKKIATRDNINISPSSKNANKKLIHAKIVTNKLKKM